MKGAEVSPNTYGELGPVFEKGDVSVNEEKMNYPTYGVGNTVESLLHTFYQAEFQIHQSLAFVK